MQSKFFPPATLLAALFICGLLFVPVLSLAASKPDSNANLDAHLERLASQTVNIASIKSDFKQVKYISFMDESLLSEGFFTYKAPDEIVWEYTKPVASGLIYRDGKATLWAGAPNAAQGDKSVNSREEGIGKVIAEQLLTWTKLDIDKLKKSYNISLVSESPVTVMVTPKGNPGDSPVHAVQLVFAADGVNVRQITLFEAEDDYTRIDFFNFQRR